MRINNNITALNTYRQLSSNNDNLARSMEKLSSGMRINRAGDDAAGMAISEKMRGQIRGLDQASRNAQDAISMIQTAEGALNETQSILQRMRELSVQGSNSTLEPKDRTAIGEEMKALAAEIDRIANSTEFNGKPLLDGSLITVLDATSVTKVGTPLAATAAGIVVGQVNVDLAVPNTTFTFSNTGSNVTLSATINGAAVSQTVSVAAMATAGEQALNFSTLGISITLTGTAAATAGDLATEITTTLQSIKTGAGSSSAQFAIGANINQTMLVDFGDMNTAELGGTPAGDRISALVLTPATALDVIDTIPKAQKLVTVIDDAITQVSKQRGVFGAAQNRLEHTINNLQTSSENLTASESRIRDVDMAREMMAQTKNNILAQAAQAMLAQANQTPQGILQLLK